MVVLQERERRSGEMMVGINSRGFVVRGLVDGSVLGIDTKNTFRGPRCCVEHLSSW